MRRRRIAAIVAVVAGLTTMVAGTASAGTGVAQHRQDPVSRAGAIVASMTLAEKITEMHGIQDATHNRFVPGIARLGIPPLVVTNGPAGVGPGDPKTQAPATALPAPEALAATWDPRQAAGYGRIMGTEAADLGNGLIEGTDVNVVRVPQNGRTFENYGEDPYLAAQLAAPNVRAVQSAGIVGEVKHFDAYSQEANRFALNQSIDERTLREIYDPPFQSAVQQGGAGAVMCSYPKINGTFSCENPGLLETKLRTDWGFTGFITSDFGATHSTVPSVNAEMNLEMPTGQFYDSALLAAVNAGQVSESAIDNLLVQRFAEMIRIGLFDNPPPVRPIPAQADGVVSRTVADQGAVLLKNDNIGAAPALPLNAATLHSIAVIGPYAGAAKTGGGGSSHVDPLYTVDPVTGIRNAVGAGTTVGYDPGTDTTAAAALAKSSDVAIVMVGDNETEGSDRSSLVLSGNQDALVRAVLAANPNTIVVLKSGGPVLMPWAGQVPALLEAWYPGEEDGNVVADLLFGKVDPSGKLPLTFPVSANDVPANTPAQYPGVNGTATYSEGVFVGYRHYDAAGIAPLFPFGYGLSYTSFAFSHLKVSRGAHGTVTVTANVTNTGHRAGAEVAQLYVGDPSSTAVPEPPNQLQGFDKVWLNPGQTGKVSFTLNSRSFSYWNTATASWRVAGGDYHLNLGDSSRHLPLTTTLRLPAS